MVQRARSPPEASYHTANAQTADNACRSSRRLPPGTGCSVTFAGALGLRASSLLSGIRRPTTTVSSFSELKF